MRENWTQKTTPMRLLLVALFVFMMHAWSAGAVVTDSVRLQALPAETNTTRAKTAPSRDDSEAWQYYLSTLYDNEEVDGSLSIEEAYEQLNELSMNPLDINSAETSDLLLIPGLTISHISDIIRHRERYGNFKSIYELMLIPSIDNNMCSYLSHFLMIGDSSEGKTEGHLFNRQAFKGRVLLSSSIPLYRRQGDMDGSYLGDPTGHSTRLTLGWGSRLRINLAGGKTAGEPFASHGNRWGYDTYAYNITYRGKGVVKQLIAGTFRGQFGMGLAMNNSFNLGKQAMLSAVGRQRSTFSPHSSTGTDGKYHQGAATVLNLSRTTQLAAFFSWRYLDATLNADSSISTIITNGYHRTLTEMAKKNNSSLTSAGLHLRYHRSTKAGLRYDIGASYVINSFSRTMNPTFSKADTIAASKLYRLFTPHGRSTWNASVDYSLKWGPLTLTGETATGDCKAAATINSILWKASSRLSLTAVQRYYSYKYYAYLGRSFGENSTVGNESGVYVAMQWNPVSTLVLSVYADYAYFPWYRYRQPPATSAWDVCVAATYDIRRWRLSARLRLKEKDSSSHRLRLMATYRSERWLLCTNVEGIRYRSKEGKDGIVVSQSGRFALGRGISVSGEGVLFFTEGYDARVYVNTLPLMNTLSFSPFYYKGVQGSVLLRAALTGRLTGLLRLTHCRYFDREDVSTGVRRIAHPWKTDIAAQVAWQL